MRELRTKRGLSQAKLAARAGVDPSTVNQIERGARDASPTTLRKIAQALDVNLVELLQEADSPKVGSSSFNAASSGEREAPEVKVSVAALHLKAEARAGKAVVLPVLRLVAEGKLSPEEGTERILHELAS